MPPLVTSPAWTPEDEQKLRTMLLNGEHPTAISKQLNRTEVAIRHRMTKLGLRLKRVKGRPVALTPSERMQAMREAVSAGGTDLRAKSK
jgi:Myb-like DNA-binding domain